MKNGWRTGLVGVEDEEEGEEEKRRGERGEVGL